ncbi:MAG: hypothetical protein ACI8PZ_000327 [Myxococcota bacterium]
MAVRAPERDLAVPLAAPLRASLSRESRQEDPALFTTLLERALRRGESICADTDEQAPVWNGVVTALDLSRVAHDPVGRTEHWAVDITARFGEARLEYLVRRHPDGRPEAFASVPTSPAVDFLWQSLPDVAAKGLEQGAWIVNDTMVERGVVTVDPASWNEGGAYVHDDQVKNMFELLYAGLSGHRWTIVHQNKRYGFTDEDAWRRAIATLADLRANLRFERPLA